MTIFERIRQLLTANRQQLNSVTVNVDDSSGWTSLTGRPHDYDPAQVQQIYADALEAWRKNPIAWRIITITTNYILGDDIHLASSNRNLSRFIHAFWSHPKNMMNLRLAPMSDELSRSGDLFVLLFRNPQDGMSYIRFVTKDRIQSIQTAPNDWETELIYYETQEIGEAKAWYSPDHPEASQQDAILLHYTVNRPLGALLGESDLTTITPWLLRYSRMLEDRVRLNWAVRSFLWDVTVPANKVKEKQEQYRTPPEAGSVIFHDETEKWQAVAPMLHAQDARFDMQALRVMIDAGSGFPPHWRGDAGDISLATAQAMQGPVERHLTRRQKYFIHMLQDIVYHAYQRKVELGMARRLPETNYDLLFTLNIPDISRYDNESLAKAADSLSEAFNQLGATLPSLPETLARYAIRMTLRFAGEPILEETIDQILAELTSRGDDVSRSIED